MFVKVFSRIIENRTETCLINLQKLLVAEQKGTLIAYTFPNKDYHKVYFPTEAEAAKTLETFEKKQKSPIPMHIHNQRWDMPSPDLESMEMIKYYEEVTNTEHLQ